MILNTLLSRFCIKNKRSEKGGLCVWLLAFANLQYGNRPKMCVAVLDNDGLGGGTHIVANVLLKAEGPGPVDGLSQSEVEVVNPKLLHVETLGDVEVGLEVVVEFN